MLLEVDRIHSGRCSWSAPVYGAYRQYPGSCYYECWFPFYVTQVVTVIEIIRVVTFFRIRCAFQFLVGLLMLFEGLL